MAPVRRGPPGEEFRAGDWIVRPAQCRITRGKAELHLRPMVMDLLVLLARRAGELVSKDEIFSAVWNGRSVVDSVLTRAIAELRRCLDDAPESPRYIETVAKRGYRFVAPVEHPSRKPEAAIAVLLFDNLSNDPRYDTFAEGLSDALITSLARRRSLRVVSRHSVLHVRKSGKILPDIASELGVDAILEGSIQHDGDHLRVTAQLIAFRPERHLWARAYDCAHGDLLRVESAVAKTVTHSVQMALKRKSGGRSSVSPGSPPGSPLQ